MLLQPPYSVAVTVLVVSLASAASAQTDKPIYPTYEGYAANPDGTYTLVFGYHSENALPVEIGPGDNNGFGPAPADRGQPVRFLPGRQRNVCRIVVPADFTGNLQWTIRHGGTTTSTTERGGVDPLYLLENIGSAYRSLSDIATAEVEKGVCINRPPTVFAGRSLKVAVGDGMTAELRAIVRDDGLPRTGALMSTWRKVSGPGSVTFAASDQATTTVTFGTAGTYELELTAHDTELEASSRVTVEVDG